MDCKLEQDEGCKGMSLFRTNKEVIIEEDSCYPGTLKVVYIKRLFFEDGSSIRTDDDILLCADKELLAEISNAIDNYLMSEKFNDTSYD